jgi:hypothetical protein
MKQLLLFFLFALSGTVSVAQIRLTQDSVLEREIIRSGLIHSPLPLDTVHSFEANGLKKKVLYSEPLSNGSLRLEFPTFTGIRAKGSPSDPDYATYGHARVTYQAKDANWEKYNRIVFDIYPDCEGARVVNLNLSFNNEASHLINLVNRQWNHCFLDIGDLKRDKVQTISFGESIKGKDRTTGDLSIYYIDRMELQKIEDPEINTGWLPGENKVVYSTTGYLPNDRKTAIFNGNKSKNKDFQLIDASTNRVVLKAAIKQEKTTTGQFDVLDFTAFNQPGVYQLQVGDVLTPPFQISDNIWENSLWRTLSFIFCQRCGYPVPGKHGTCHTDLFSEHDGKKISYAGGWHDAGDLSQQTLQTGDVTYSLLECYNQLKGKNDLLAMRLLEEAEWGLEFMLKNRYGDGYRASSMGLLIWQDGIIGTLDDIYTVRVQNLAFDNFLHAAYEAYAALSIDSDPMLQEYLRRVAKEDFEWAVQRHKEVGFGEFLHLYEHSYNTSESQYMATVSWAASMLYKLTKEPQYAELAAEYIRYTVDCQRKEPLNDKDHTKGFFYRDKSRKSIVHYIHQSREQVYMQAMTLLCETQPNHPDYPDWSESIRLYGDYLKSLMQYTAPYGLLPGGVYHINEYQDSISFNHLHLFPPANAKELYVEQVQKGIQLDKEHYIKRFPVWFGIFNGNTAVHLSTGKAAAICGKFLNDKELLGIGLEQMYWTVGKNPFGQSLIYGEGHNYPQMDSFSSGEMTGEMPVGIRTLGNEDIPYWPQINNACYKEVWVTSAGKWLTLAAEYE